MSWTEDRVEILKKLWAEGLSASQIANRLGGCTRNAVIGKVSRLGLTRSDKPAPKGSDNSVARADRIRARSKIEQERKEQAELAVLADLRQERQADPPHRQMSIIDLTERMCRWPIGDPGDEDFHFCGRNSPLGVPYCEHHQSISRQPAWRQGRSAAGQ